MTRDPDIEPSGLRSRALLPGERLDGLPRPSSPRPADQEVEISTPVEMSTCGPVRPAAQSETPTEPTGLGRQGHDHVNHLSASSVRHDLQCARRRS